MILFDSKIRICFYCVENWVGDLRFPPPQLMDFNCTFSRKLQQLEKPRASNQVEVKLRMFPEFMHSVNIIEV